MTPLVDHENRSVIHKPVCRSPVTHKPPCPAEHRIPAIVL